MTLLKKIAKQVGWYFLIMLVSSIPSVFLLSDKVTNISLKWGLGLGYLVLIFCFIRWLWKVYRKHENEKVLQQVFGWKDFGIAFLFYLLIWLSNVLCLYLNYLVYGNMTTSNQAFITATNEQLSTMFPLYVLIFNLYLGIVAPIIEEVVFRGFMTKYFFQNRKILGLLITATLFALPHVPQNPAEFALYFNMGAIFYLAYRRRENIKDAIAVHFLNNGLLMVISIVNYLLLLLDK